MSALQEPRPLQQGAVRGSAGTGFDLQRAGPSLQVAARVGLGAGVETRLKLVMPRRDLLLVGAEAGLNWQPWDSERVGLFLMPHYRYYHVEEDFDDLFDEYCCQDRTIHAFALPTLVVFHLAP
ncbi:MAG TPA: hypothetical protein VFX59_26815 [Polyangiales bacterium]|nr:hypothetical protein [Polyangiales bacterium]